MVVLDLAPSFNARASAAAPRFVWGRRGRPAAARPQADRAHRLTATASGVTGFDAAEAGPLPALFVAFTLNV